ncbi:DEAD/DEAH box helicase [Micromonospora parathelypteridis]|uniref:ATP-dependent Lhr-like helicase n=1 Tax=Micromonospora parathelypteridis TaxID=1839617 RepID=A0A840W5N8_9ACTN|nr:DEAD/DEAH box helicase [Micromonospora parathelypteridis]MBB5479519.1 ATP-dependent Lhr-like helicase [Micromonospora parathelypteridis]GGO30364.1 ATP-dependent helicase [Micromonospora parathelypteridis]
MNEERLLDPVVLHHVVNSLGWPDLRPLQRASIGPLVQGDDALLLAPTAGGKTEAALFPLLSRMAEQSWTGTSLLYLCPLKALLNNLLPRLERYAGWLGRAVALWHGDVATSARRAVLWQRPDILLSTPESLEAMLVSVNVDHRLFFAGLRAVVVDEVHAFAGDDRGWHLLAVLERLTRVTDRPLQRVGLSATVGNPDQLLTWLQGSGAGSRPGRVIAPELRDKPAADSTAPPPGQIELDYVGSLTNAAKVISALHAGEKRLVFCESRQTVEELGQLLRERGITTFLSHASLSADERRRSEQAFAEARDCVIVSTSTLELGIDVGDLDRFIQIDSPATVASFLQRLGRTGRRPGGTRNCLLLCRSGAELTKAAALLLLWGRGWVEPVVAPPEPRHIVAQQVMALCLQEHRIGDRLWSAEWNGLGPFGPGAEPIVRHLVDQGYLDGDGGLLFIGPEAERRFGRRHFMEMTAVFTGPPEFTVLHGRTELGRVDPSLLTEKVPGERRLLLGGRAWRVTYVDWRRRRCFVEPADGGGRARWTASGWVGTGHALTRAMRDVLLGADPPVQLTARAKTRLSVERDERSALVHPGGSMAVRTAKGDLLWWTWAGLRANATLAATLSEVVDPAQRFDDYAIRLRDNLTSEDWRSLVADAGHRICLPEVNDRAVAGLKFSTALPERLARATLAARLADLPGAAALLDEPVRFVVLSP